MSKKCFRKHPLEHDKNYPLFQYRTLKQNIDAKKQTETNRIHIHFVCILVRAYVQCNVYKLQRNLINASEASDEAKSGRPNL